jgi:hypothetical protein
MQRPGSTVDGDSDLSEGRRTEDEKELETWEVAMDWGLTH